MKNGGDKAFKKPRSNLDYGGVNDEDDDVFGGLCINANGNGSTDDVDRPLKRPLEYNCDNSCNKVLLKYHMTN